MTVARLEVVRDNRHQAVGYIILGMFIATWAVAVSVWRYGHIEERWTARAEVGTDE